LSGQYFNNDTIAAVITAQNAIAGVGVIRISGERAWESVVCLLSKHGHRSTFEADGVESHKLFRCVVARKDGSPLDDGMFVWMKAPHSFTGEHVIELHLHGNPLVLRLVMQELLHQGVREALPGEFSFRAFRNGKLTLDQAEAVADMVSSRSESGAMRALNHLLGTPRAEIERMKRVLIDRLAEVEMDIDFSDQGLSLFQHDSWASKLENWVGKVEVIREEFIRSQPLRDGIRLALVGEPNSGKSSLFNRLLGEDRSIVSDEAGTTRDIVRESTQFGGLLFRLSDTAGIRSTANEIEAKGIEKTFGEAGSAHLALWVFDGATYSAANDLRSSLLEMQKRIGKDTELLAVWNKVDLSPVNASWQKFFLEENVPTVAVSAKSGNGLALLKEEIAQIFSRGSSAQPDFSISRTRHYEVLGRAVEFVGEAVRKVRSGEHFPDLLAADLKAALQCFGELTGEFTSDDLLNHIFAEFCIGK
jgi:tRNA modification GTPase